MEEKPEKLSKEMREKVEKSYSLNYENEIPEDQINRIETNEYPDASTKSKSFKDKINSNSKLSNYGTKYDEDGIDRPIKSNLENQFEISEESNYSDKEMKEIYTNKLIDLNKKIEDYEEKYKKVEEFSKELEDRNTELLKKQRKYEESTLELEYRVEALEESKNEYQDKSKKLQEAREQLLNLTKEIEEKKKEIETKENNLLKMQKTLEKNKYELEKERIDFNKQKLELEFDLKSNKLESEVLASDNNKYYLKIPQDQELVKKEKKFEGKSELLFRILKNLSNEGYFQSTFLIDSKGMMISEYCEDSKDNTGIGAMFSLISTSVLRTIKSLNLQELNYFKLSSTNGDFMINNINISGYERNFILLSYFDNSTPTFSKSKKLNKKMVRNLIKSIKKDFKFITEENEISWVFDNLHNKIKFLKEKFQTASTDLQEIRFNKIKESSIKIRELFEN
ncbi:MAG: hypothetical protein P8Y70_04595 [Candidatus Lokiarchaeota archaeon]